MELIKTIALAPFKALHGFFLMIEDVREMQNVCSKKYGKNCNW